MKGKSILYVSSELYPYSTETNLAKKALNGPKELLKNENDVRIFIPRFGFINQRRYQIHEVIRLSGMNIIINDIDQPLVIKVATVPEEKVQVYFIHNDEYFNFKTTYFDDNGNFFKYNDERCIFFARSVLETIKKLNWKPDIIHVHGWMASLVPLYLKKFYSEDAFYTDTMVVNSLFNDSFTEKLDQNFIDKLKMDGFLHEDIFPLEEPTYENLIKLSLMHSDVFVKGEENISKSVEEIANSINGLEILPDCLDENIYASYSTIYQQVLETNIIR